jgi:hypothetical protein
MPGFPYCRRRVDHSFEKNRHPVGSAHRQQQLLLSVSGMPSGHGYTQIMSAEGTLAIEKTRCA